ncbi:MAG: alpha/beta fold hydrolase [Candidatus Eremiobacteraeota bacterium]|nr:alpha/beta fold hydrolase [Candidatus Eremiobacteraeota bacterium]MBV8499216.1 alpha/beta fold hydrolase [Candidatus Eremiobacteraeota bacterium]
MATVELFRLAAERDPLAVLWYQPRRPRGVSLVAGHGYSSSKHNLDFLCSFLSSHGFGVYSLDFPGHKLGASGGELRGVDGCIEAMQRVVAFARERGDDASYTLGHSMGGMTAIFAAAQDAEILGTVAIATGYGRPTSLEALQKVGATDFRASYVVGVTLPELVAGVDARYARLLPRLAGRRALYVAASRDGMVSPRSVRELYERAPDPKTFAMIDSDHTYAAEHAKATVLEWLRERH